jgi:O-antigen/teichoic acid export membrane protein
MGTGHHRQVAAACVAESLINLALSIVLVRTHGLFGVALGTAIAVTAVNLLWLMPAACRSIALPYGRFLFNVTRTAAVPMVVTWIAGTLMLSRWTADDLGSVLLQAAVLGATYSVTFLATLPRGLRDRYVRALAGPRVAMRLHGSRA